VAQALAASHGFQLLISYTDTGFQPASATIKKGQTIRFTNNSSGQLQIVADGKTPLPAASSEVSGQFWEFTFTDSGTWQYENTLNPKYSGMIRVQ
jgi:plastocyanin